MILGSTVFGVVARLSDGNDQAYDHWLFMAFTIPRWESFELIIIGIYGSIVFGVVGFIIANDCFLLTDKIVNLGSGEDSIHGK